MLVGALAVATVEAVAHSLLIQGLVDGLGPNVAEYLDISVPTLIGAFGLLTVGRVMRQTVEMREELDATV